MHDRDAAVSRPSSDPILGVPRSTLLFPSADSIHAGVRAVPQSDRPTRRTLSLSDSDSDSVSRNESSVIELSAADLLDTPSSSPARTAPPPPQPPRRWLVLTVRATLGGALVFGIAAALLGPFASAAPARDPRLAWPDRTAIAEPSSGPEPAPPRRGCVVAAPARIVASRALVNAGLDVVGSGTGFLVSFATTPTDASSVRLEGSRLRAAETVRVHVPGPVRHVVARDGELLDVYVDPDEARTIPNEADGPPLRIGPRGASMVARVDDRVHDLWPLPEELLVHAPAFTHVGRPMPPVAVVDALRAGPRDDGGAVIALKRRNRLWVGAVQGSLAAQGPLTSITRSGATVGKPFVVAHGSGGVVTWAEHPGHDGGAHEWTVMLATFGGETIDVRAIGPGMSPSLAVLPDGELLLAYSDGPPSAHRVAVRRLGRDLAPIGEPVIASTQGMNAGQPVLTVRPDGHALVAWFAVAHGQPASVLATPLTCDLSH